MTAHGDGELCGAKPFERLSGCVLPVGHDGQHVFARGEAKRGNRWVVNFYRASPRGASFAFVGHGDGEGPKPTAGDAARLWETVQLALEQAGSAGGPPCA